MQTTLNNSSISCIFISLSLLMDSEGLLRAFGNGGFLGVGDVGAPCLLRGPNAFSSFSS